MPWKSQRSDKMDIHRAGISLSWIIPTKDKSSYLAMGKKDGKWGNGAQTWIMTIFKNILMPLQHAPGQMHMAYDFHLYRCHSLGGVVRQRDFCNSEKLTVLDLNER